MDKLSITPSTGGDEPSAAPIAHLPGFKDRPYERRLMEGGRRIISVDIDTKLLENLDRIRGKLRRGIFLDQLIAEACENEGAPRMSG